MRCWRKHDSSFLEALGRRFRKRKQASPTIWRLLFESNYINDEEFVLFYELAFLTDHTHLIQNLKIALLLSSASQIVNEKNFCEP